jgi:3-hydroxyisobutyrate dehydrogenase-like beta-hydroxyacid dehydrogenase
MDLGFVGLGRMGGAMAQRLLEAGHRVIVYDVDADACTKLRDRGAVVAAHLRELADAAPIVFASLPSPQIVIEAVLGPGGLIEGKGLELCIDLSTSGPAVAIRLAAGLAARGVASIEAPVSGGIKGAREGTLSLMVAGPEAAWKRAASLIGLLGKPYFMGEAPGAGQTMKLVNNLLGACAIAITAEGMTVGIKAGLDPARMIEVLNASTGRNSATSDKWPRAVLPRTFDFGFAAGLCLKDLRLCLAEAEALGVPLGVGAQVRALLERTVDRYGGESDFTAMTKIVEADAGLDPERPL